MKKILYILIISVFVASCDEWLEINPKTEVNEDKLFSTGLGYRNALNGLYLKLATEDLYAKNLSYGFIDAWSQAIVTSEEYQIELNPIKNFDYEHKYSKAGSEAIWTNGYKTIANCNNLIKNITAADTSIFKYGDCEKNMIWGEALAIRAFMHFDLLRIYAKAYKVDPSGEYIPYVDKYPSKVNVPMATNEILDKIISDLDKSLELLKDYDVDADGYASIKSTSSLSKANGFTGGESSFDDYFSGRRLRFNYVNVVALLSRVALYAEKYDRVKECTALFEDFVNVKKILKWTPSYKLSTSVSSVDRKRSYDVLLGLYNENLPKKLEHYFIKDIQPARSLVVEDIDGIFASIPGDKRKNMFDENGISAEYKMGYHKNDEKTGYYLPNLRLSEVFYNAAEAVFKEDPSKAAAYVNVVLKARGVKSSYYMPVVDSYDEFIEWIVTEYRKEFIGEGQLFFLYKRLNIGFKYSGGTIQNDGNCILPVPLSEAGL